MEFDQESTGDFLTNAACYIFKGDIYSLSFDEIYSSVYYSIPKFGIDFVVKAILEGLTISLEEDRESLFSQDGDEFNQFLLDLSHRIFKSFDNVKAAFRPVFISSQNINYENEIIKRYREVIFMNQDNSQKINNFIIKYAHTLPGSFNIEDETPMIKLLHQVLFPSPLWDLFIDHICESTDSLCLYVSSALISQDPCKNNPIAYFSAVLDMFSNEEKLWKLLPNKDHERLHYLMLTCLIFDLKDDYLFKEENKLMMVRAFYEDLRNLDTFKKILVLFINDNSIISEFVMVLFQHFTMVIENLASEPANSLQASSLVTETIISIFERIRILQSETILGSSPIFDEMLDNFRRKVLSKDNLNFESNSAKTIGMKISNVCSDPSKERELKIFVNEIGKLISYTDNKLLFIDTHNSLMFGRLCMYAGQQYKLEQTVINILEPYMPPSLSEPFQEKLKAFEESEEINKKWSLKPFGNHLSVFILSSAKAPNLNTRFGNLILPPEMKKWQDNFTAFFQSMKKGNVLITFIYEDNLVEMNVKFPKCQNQFILKSPLIFSVIMNYICVSPGATFEEISRATGLRVKDVETVVAKGAQTKEFMIFKLTKGPTPEQTRVAFNMNFSSPKQKFSIMLPNRFKLNLDTAEMMKNKRLKMYQTNIAKVVKENGRVDEDDLSPLVSSSLPTGIQFNLEEYNESLSYLVSKNILIRRGNYYQYVDE